MENEHPKFLRRVLPYIKHHRGKTFVVKCGGEIVSNAAALDQLALDLSLCANINFRIVLVHGGGPQLSELSKKLGIETKKVSGRRVTDEATLEVAVMTFCGTIRTKILAALRKHGVQPWGLSGVDAGIIHAVPRPASQEIDPDTGELQLVEWGLVGDIQSVHTDPLQNLLNTGYIPVMSSLGGDDDGNVYNINADTVAGAIAVSLKADKLILLTSAPGLLANRDDPTTLISHATVQRCRDLIDRGAVTGGMVPKLQTVIAAVERGVPRVHILDGRSPDSLLMELLTKQGTGTMITTREEEKRYLGE